jgi:hypothetical protein
MTLNTHSDTPSTRCSTTGITQQPNGNPESVTTATGIVIGPDPTAKTSSRRVRLLPLQLHPPC